MTRIRRKICVTIDVSGSVEEKAMKTEDIIKVFDNGSEDTLKALLLGDHDILMHLEDGFTRAHIIASATRSSTWKYQNSLYLGKKGKDYQILKMLYSSGIPVTLAYQKPGFFLPWNTPLSLATEFKNIYVAEFLFQATLLELLEITPELAQALSWSGKKLPHTPMFIENRVRELFKCVSPNIPTYKNNTATKEQMQTARLYGLYVSINSAFVFGYTTIEPQALAVIYALQNSDADTKTKQEFMRAINALMKFGKESTTYLHLTHRAICKNWGKATILCGDLEIPVELQKKIIDFGPLNHDLTELFFDYFKVTNQFSHDVLEQKAFKAHTGAGCSIL